MKGRDAGTQRIILKFILRNYHMRFLSDVIGTCPASVAGSKGSTKEEGDFPTINGY
jgi:hypothetical protein